MIQYDPHRAADIKEVIDPTFGWTTVLDTLLVAYVYFGIEEIGVEIEGPFGFDDNDLPLEAICETIRQNAYELASIGLPGPRHEITGPL